MVQKFKQENFFQEDLNLISKIGHLVSILRFIKQKYIFLTHPVHQWDIMNTSGEYLKYIGGSLAHQRDIMIHVGRYHEYIEGCSLH